MFVVAFVGMLPSPGAISGDLERLVAAGRVDGTLVSAVEHSATDALVGFESLDAAHAALLDPIPGVSVAHRYQNVASIKVSIESEEALLRVARLPGFLSVHADGVSMRSTVQALPLINAPIANNSGYTGEGTTVAVLDTGADCELISGDDPCPVIWAGDIAEDDGVADDDGHGTNVSAIVHAVAPGAGIAALDVFTDLGDGRVGVVDSDGILGIDAVLERAEELNIVAVNLSLGNSFIRHLTECVFSDYTPAFAALRAANILPVVAAGNGATSGGVFFSGLADPACAPGALTVGAAYDADHGTVNWPLVDPLDLVGIMPASPCTDSPTFAGKPACFSQSGNLLDVWAFGPYITAGGYTMAGTSQAAPQVAGAVALLAEAAPGSTASTREAAIVSSGASITDTRNGVTRRFLEICGALSDVEATCGGPPGFSLDRLAVPEGYERWFYIDVTAPTGLLTVRTVNSTGDIDLYVERDGGGPTCAAETEAGDETCTIANAPAARYWVIVHVFEDGAFSLRSGASSTALSPRVRLPFLSRQ